MDTIDLHSHTVCSDGADQPAEVFKKAMDLGLEVLSITDHNTIKAYEDPDLMKAVAANPGHLLRGIEITCMDQGEVVEVLGYGYNPDILQKLLDQYVLKFDEKQKQEYELVKKMLEEVQAVYDLRKIRFDPAKESCRKSVWKELLMHPENDHLFLHASSREKSGAFTRQEIYNPESPLHVDESSLYPSVKKAVDMIHQAGGIAFLAHLYEYADADERLEVMEDFVRHNQLDGLECRHHCFSPEQSQRLEDFCSRHVLLKSGGSDYHGTRKPGVLLGNVPEMRVPEEYLNQWPRRILNTIL